ncbi:helix-turn-helix transcriptional regulator [Streptomyces sp. LP05-1]|uniref:Helix-turn-helix transcriptional regulator n=1 Tax=Streptomyces pyxinae TaxID=2970734 RepID=A0ABT2CJK1_9ACTN|nr:helix-turn-helix transcriptional regulator [Streptomyces sp. LP05-1]MCS0636769.1 helix-turn-helix transcriptional regulator [Streptomyces sp. LP05-1]
MDKTALGTLLRERRALIAPESLGLSRPTRQGRRAPGLSQAQIDQLLHRAPDTYGRLESGRYPNPPVQLLQDVAALLGLTEQEWTALWRYAAGQDPPRPLDTRSGEEVPGAWQEALDGMSHMAYVSDRSWNLLARNPRFDALFPGGTAPSNIMRWMAVDPAARNVLRDWETAWAPRLLPQLRSALAADPGDRTLAAIEREVLADPLAAPLYEESHAYVGLDGDERPVDHTLLGPGWVTLCAAHPMGAPGARMVIMIFRPGVRRGPAAVPALRAGAPGRPG